MMVTARRRDMSLYAILISTIVLAVCAYFGLLRPTGLAGRTPAERAEDERRDLASKWLNKDDGQKQGRLSSRPLPPSP